MLTKTDIKLIRSLSDRGERRRNGLFAVEGPKSVKELLASDYGVARLFATEQYAAVLGDGRTETVSPSELERISAQRTPQGCVALAVLPERKFTAGIFGRAPVLALDGVQDPGNVGSITRTAAWFGMYDMICSETTADIFGPKAVQASMGAFLRVRVFYGDLPEMLSRAKMAGTEVFGTFLEGENIYRAALPETGVTVLGNEGNGVGPRTAAEVGRRLYIPAFADSDSRPAPAWQMACPLPDRKGAESLNVAAAAAVVCSEFRRRIQ